ncbi:restriction endonuclease subunit S [Vibrio parahaemolyticus]|nr:restriction endonuclease subunit S [Vibrio parahaemolyticus]
MVPNGWVEKSLKDICNKTISYGIVQTGENIENGVPCVRVVDLSKNTLNPVEMIKTSDEIHQSYKKTILCEGELMMALRGEIGLVKKVTPELIGANITRGLARLSPIKSVDSDYLLWTLRSNKIKNELARKSGGSALQEIALGSLRKVVLPIPPFPEQRKIAKILSTWDKAIATTEKLIETSKQQKKALMQQLLTGKKRLVNPETGKAFEGEWEEVKLGEYSQVTSSKRVLKSDYVVTGVPFYRSKEIILKSNNIEPKEVLYISEEQFDLLSKKHGRPDTGDILITAVGSLGVPYLVQEKETFYFKDGNLLWLRKLNELDGSFLIHYMKSEEFQNKIDSITGGSSQKALTIVKLATLTVPMPSMEEQQKIASVLTAADKEIGVLESKFAHFKQEKKALMQQLLTGTRRVKIDDKEVA